MSDISSADLVQQATLGLYHELNALGQGNTFNIYRNTASWDESTVTYNSQPSYDGQIFASLSISDLQLELYREWDVTQLVRGWIAGNYPNYGLRVSPTDIFNQRPYLISSDEANPNERPYLKVEVGGFPVPAFSNRTFENGLAEWLPSPASSVSVVEISPGSGDYAAKLTAASEVGIEQTTLVPSGDYMLTYDYQFGSTGGTLDVYVGTTLIDTVIAPATISEGLQTRAVLVDDLSAQVGGPASVSFRFVGQTGEFMLLDNIAVPEPASISLVAVGLLCLIGFTRRKR